MPVLLWVTDRHINHSLTQSINPSVMFCGCPSVMGPNPSRWVRAYLHSLSLSLSLSGIEFGYPSRSIEFQFHFGVCVRTFHGNKQLTQKNGDCIALHCRCRIQNEYKKEKDSCEEWMNATLGTRSADCMQISCERGSISSWLQVGAGGQRRTRARGDQCWREWSLECVTVTTSVRSRQVIVIVIAHHMHCKWRRSLTTVSTVWLIAW